MDAVLVVFSWLPFAGAAQGCVLLSSVSMLLTLQEVLGNLNVTSRVCCES